MFDLITYTKDSQAFLAEVYKKFPNKVSMTTGTSKNFKPKPLSVSLTKTPTIRGASGTLSVVRCDAVELKDLKTLTSVKILSEVPIGGDPLKSMTKANRKIYDSIHSQKPVPVLDDKGKPLLDSNGKAVLYTPPALIGSFA